MARVWLSFIAVCCALVACGEEEQKTGPEDVVADFVAAMRRVHGESGAGDAVAGLLWKPARENLEERARRASALSGRELSPGEMIVPSWFALHVSPDRIEARRDRRWAEVTVHGAHESVQMRCIREDGEWKVALELPPLAPIRNRSEAR